MNAVEHLGADFHVVGRDAFAASLAKGAATSPDLVVGKSIDPGELEPVSVKGSQVQFVGTSSKLDRDNDVIRAKGVDHENWSRRPVILAGHDARVRIGTGLNAELRGNRWIITAEYFPKELSEIAAFYREMIDFNIGLKNKSSLKDVGAVYSIGFRPIEAKWNEQRGGIDFNEVEALEYSDVSLASNPGAQLLEAKAAGVNVDPLFDWAADICSKSGLVTVRPEFAQKLIELIEPPKGLELFDLTAQHLDHLKNDSPRQEEPVEVEAEAFEPVADDEFTTGKNSELVDGDPTALAYRAAKMGLTASQTQELLVAAGWPEFAENIKDPEPPQPVTPPEPTEKDWQDDLFVRAGNNGLPEQGLIKELVASVLSDEECNDLWIERVAAKTGHIPEP